MMRESSSDIILDLFTKGSHHKNISVIFITQHVFHKGKVQRDISPNTKYLVLLKNPRNKAQIQYLARQILSEDSLFLRDTFFDAMRLPHSYLFIDLSQDCLDEIRFVATCSPMTRCITHTYQSILNHADDTTRLLVGKELWPCADAAVA